MCNRLVLIFVVWLSALCLAQNESATLSGRVTDPNGASIVGAEVVLTNMDTNIEQRTKTNSVGLNVFTGVHPGRYRAAAGSTGFKTLIKENLVLHVQDEIAENFSLAVGSFSETVTVEANGVNVNTTDATVSTVVDRQFVENLPLNGRSFQTLIELAPGVVVTPSTSNDPGQFSVNGQRSSANYFTVDGVSANIGVQPSTVLGQGGAGTIGGFGVSGGTNNLVSEDALQEFRIQTSTFAAEFGRTPGAQVSILTRSGTNQFHGTLFEFLRNDKLDANDWFADQLGLPKSEERINDFGGVFGGPIIKDKTFFFFSYEGQRLRLPQTGITTVPDLAARQTAPAAVQPFLNAYPLPNGPEILDSSGNPTPMQAQFNAGFSNQSSLNAYSIRIDQTLNSRLNVFGRYTNTPSDALQRGGGSNSLNTLLAVRVRTQTITLGGAWSITPTLSDEVRFNYSRNDAVSSERLDTFGGAVIPPESALFPSPFTSANADYVFSIGGLQGTSWNLGPTGANLQRQFNVVDNISVQRGSHSLKFGLDYRRLSPVFNPPSYLLEPTFIGVPSAVSNAASQVTVIASRGGTALFRNLGLFAQDTWRVTPRLTLSYGLRWDLDLPPSTINGPDLLAVTGFNNPSVLAPAAPGTPVYKTKYDNFAPRVGAAYQLRQAAGWETILRGGFGIFYDLASVQAGQALGFNTFPFGAQKRVFSNLAFPLDPSVTQPPPISVSQLASGNLVGFDPNLESPRAFQWNATLEQSLGNNQALSVAYVAAVGRRLLQNEQIVFPNPNIFIAELVDNSGTSDYHSLQVQFQRRLSRGFQALASYTWAHSIDTASSGSLGEASNFIVSTLGPNQNRGASDFDIRHTFSAAVTYAVPKSRAESRLVHGILDGWFLDSIIQARSAPPLTAFDPNLAFSAISGFDLAVVRPDVVAGNPLYLHGSQYPGGKALNPAAFVDPPIDPSTGFTVLRQGTLGRNALRGFGAAQWDFAVRREIVLHESWRLQFRGEFFNVLNHPNFATPIGDRTNPFFGQSLSMLSRGLSENSPGDGSFASIFQLGGPRSIQFGLKLLF